MKDELLYKVLKDKAIDILKKKEYDIFERASIIKSVIDNYKGSVLSLSKELGVERNELLRAVQVLNASDYVKDKITKGEIKGYVVNRLIYGLRDPSKIDVLVDEVIVNNLNAEQVDNLVSRTNNPNLVSNHLVSELWRSKNRLTPFLEIDIPKNRVEDTLSLIIDLRTLFELLESKFKQTVEVEQ